MQRSLLHPVLSSNLRRRIAPNPLKCTRTPGSTLSPLSPVPQYRTLLRTPRRPYLWQTRNLNTGPLQNLFDSSTVTGIQIRNVSEAGGIELEDGLTLRSACILLSGRVFLWQPPAQREIQAEVDRDGKGGDDRKGVWTGWTKEDFEIFDVVAPKPELLLLGTGKRMELPPPAVREYLREIGVQVDVMDTRNACSTFNLLSEEGRRVAAALLPLGPIAPWK